MIGSRCKRREALSRAVLIGRALLPRLSGVAVGRPSVRGLAALCGPQGTGLRPAPSQPNAPRWSATMAGEVHPVPFRTRKLSPLAPMVLRSSPWESRTSLTNEGHLLFSGPAGSNRRARFSFGRGPFVCPGAATPSRFHRCRFPWSTRPRLPLRPTRAGDAFAICGRFLPAGGMSVSGTPCDHVFQAGSGPFGRSTVPRHIKQTISPRHLARW